MSILLLPIFEKIFKYHSCLSSFKCHMLPFSSLSCKAIRPLGRFQDPTGGQAGSWELELVTVPRKLPSQGLPFILLVAPVSGDLLRTSGSVSLELTNRSTPQVTNMIWRRLELSLLQNCELKQSSFFVSLVASQPSQTQYFASWIFAYDPFFAIEATLKLNHSPRAISTPS